MSVPKLLIVNKSQFGYQAGYYYYAKYLRSDYDITFLCHDNGLEKLELKGVKVKYIGLRKGKLKRNLNWIKVVANEIDQEDYDLIFTVYFKLCFLIGLLFSGKKMILDIRSGSLKRNPLANYIQNLQIRFESLFFHHITILSRGLIKHLHLNQKKCHWLPLGAELTVDGNCGYKKMNLLYVGTLQNRNIQQTIQGFGKFYKLYGEYVSCSYNIFGFGTPKEETLIRERIKALELDGVIRFHGQKNHLELEPYFKNCNVGISYVPITDYFEFQPPTKTFEYILSGMVCIGTATFENIRLINKKNGILCRDTSFSFYEALRSYYYKRHLFKYPQLVGTLKNYTWTNIVNNNLKPYLKQLESDV